MLVLNGRHVGDLNGKFMCTKNNGWSSIDMFIVQQRFVSNIVYFKVLDAMPYSDHNLVWVLLSANAIIRT